MIDGQHVLFFSVVFRKTASLSTGEIIGTAAANLHIQVYYDYCCLVQCAPTASSLVCTSDIAVQRCWGYVDDCAAIFYARSQSLVTVFLSQPQTIDPQFEWTFACPTSGFRFIF